MVLFYTFLRVEKRNVIHLFNFPFFYIIIYLKQTLLFTRFYCKRKCVMPPVLTTTFYLFIPLKKTPNAMTPVCLPSSLVRFNLYYFYRCVLSHSNAIPKCIFTVTFCLLYFKRPRKASSASILPSANQCLPYWPYSTDWCQD